MDNFPYNSDLSNGGVRWSIIVAWVLLFACEPSPGSLTINGYILGIAGQIMLGKHSSLSPIDLPVRHSTVPCFPTLIIALDSNLFSSQWYCAMYLWGGGRSGECISLLDSVSYPLWGWINTQIFPNAIPLIEKPQSSKSTALDGSPHLSTISVLGFLFNWFQNF